MDGDTRRRFELIERELSKQQQQISQRPMWQAVGVQTGFPVYQIVGGNLALSPSGEAGIKRVVAAPADMPVYDLTTLPTCVNGVGYGRNVYSNELALIGLFPPSLIKWDLWASCGSVWCPFSVQVLVTGSSPATYQSVLIPMTRM